MDQNRNFLVVLNLLLNSIQKRRNMLINNLINTHNHMLMRMQEERRVLRQETILKLNASVPRIFFSAIKPRFRGVQKLIRLGSKWETLQQPGNESMYFEAFRMSAETFFLLCRKLEPFLEETTCSALPSLPVAMQVAICVYKLASCAEYRVVGDAFAVHKSTVHKYFHAVINAINELSREFIKFPTLTEAIEFGNKFERKCHIPNIIGAIDGTHIPILPPSEGYRDYINRKGWPSIVMQSVVDCNYMFIDVSVKHPGSSHDALVFRESGLFKNADRIIPQHTKLVDNVSTPLFLIGDPAYPLLSWLMKPYIGHVTPEEESFNCYLSTARMVVENAFGRLKARWRCLCKRIDVDPELVPHVVLACTILHNFVEQNKETFHESWNSEAILEQRDYPQPESEYSAEVLVNTIDPKSIRDHLKNYMRNNFPMRQSDFRH